MKEKETIKLTETTRVWQQIHHTLRGIVTSKKADDSQKIFALKESLKRNRYLHDYCAAEFYYLTYKRILENLVQEFGYPYLKDMIEFHEELWSDNKFIINLKRLQNEKANSESQKDN